ncbi:zinc finger HIT domain-containing protein 2 [Planococcus citri]|uniref:zinc finger HIT domain-containing protein 2 n=1 Tax=Planococcus citri TaxID=170843 RepID=UPI0031FA085D
MEIDTAVKNCAFCSKATANYTCPRCNLIYCSKTCYQSQQHLDCSEQFYKECIEEDLKLENIDHAGRNQMMEILKRFQENADEDDEIEDRDSDDEDSLPDLYERLENVNLNDADEIWGRLSEQEKLEFQAILKSGDVSQLIPEYEPWWCKRYDKNIEDLDDFMKKKNKEQYVKICPTIKEISPFSSLCKVTPSPCILWNICNVLASYAFTVRRYLGEHQDYCCESLHTILDLSANLNSNVNFDSKKSSVDNVIFQVTNNAEYSSSKEEANILHEDIEALLAGPEKPESNFYMLSALSDLHQLFNQTLIREKNKDKKKTDGEFSKMYPSQLDKTFDKSKLRSSMKKIDFYSSWVKDLYHLSV